MKFLLLIFFVFILTPFSSSFADEFTKVNSIKLIKEAEMKYKKALKVKNAWRDTKKLIKKAKSAHDKNEFKKSVTIAKKALNEAEMAIQQYEKQKDKYRFLD